MAWRTQGIKTIKLKKSSGIKEMKPKYADGGFVTSMRVPKGQAKWLKKFVEQMRNK